MQPRINSWTFTTPHCKTPNKELLWGYTFFSFTSFTEKAVLHQWFKICIHALVFVIIVEVLSHVLGAQNHTCHYLLLCQFSCKETLDLIVVVALPCLYFLVWSQSKCHPGIWNWLVLLPALLELEDNIDVRLTLASLLLEEGKEEEAIALLSPPKNLGNLFGSFFFFFNITFVIGVIL